MLGDNIKKIRESVGISQRELGRRIGKTGQYISYLEISEKVNPSLEVLNSIAEALGVSTLDFINSDEQTELFTNAEDNEIKTMLNTSDNHLAIFLMLKNFKCFEALNISFITHKDLIFLSQIISNNIVSTIETFKNKHELELINKFNNFILSSDESVEDEKSNNEELMKKNDELRGNINQLENDIKELEKENLNSKPSTLFKSIKNHLSKNIKNEDIGLENLKNENKDLENEVNNLENEVNNLENELKDLIFNRSND